MTALATKQLQKYAIHGVRIGVLISIAYLMRLEQNEVLRSVAPDLNVSSVRELFSAAVSLEPHPAQNRLNVIGENGESLGYVLQTSPTCDHILGFSGPTNVLIGLSNDDEIIGIKIQSSGDTRDHVRQIEDDPDFMDSLDSLHRDQASKASYDVVSGATLTSFAIRESIALRLGKTSATSLRFPHPPQLEMVQTIFATAAETNSKASAHQELYEVLDSQGLTLGSILRTSPAADNTIGFQGPTDAYVAFGQDGKTLGLAIGETFDNDPYVGYVREDDYFLKSFNELTLEQLANLDLLEAQVEGVSGATMTSMAVADGIIVAAQAHVAKRNDEAAKSPPNAYSVFLNHDTGTILVVLFGAVIGLTRLRGNKTVAFVWKLVLIVYLGIIAGNLISQAMLVGWAQNGIPTRNALGLLCLATAALCLPILTRRNLYCTHVCPHGAIQQLARRRIGWQPKLPSWLNTFLRLLPALLLVWCVVVGMTQLGFSLVDIEPFDAYVFLVAGWATIAIAVVGLGLSFFIPMAYCRYGCPTGALLEFLRFNAKANVWTTRDWAAVGLLLLALGLRLY